MNTEEHAARSEVLMDEADLLWIDPPTETPQQEVSRLARCQIKLTHALTHATLAVCQARASGTAMRCRVCGDKLPEQRGEHVCWVLVKLEEPGLQVTCPICGHDLIAEIPHWRCYR